MLDQHPLYLSGGHSIRKRELYGITDTRRQRNISRESDWLSSSEPPSPLDSSLWWPAPKWGPLSWVLRGTSAGCGSDSCRGVIATPTPSSFSQATLIQHSFFVVFNFGLGFLLTTLPTRLVVFLSSQVLGEHTKFLEATLFLDPALDFASSLLAGCSLLLLGLFLVKWILIQSFPPDCGRTLFKSPWLESLLRLPLNPLLVAPVLSVSLMFEPLCLALLVLLGPLPWFRFSRPLLPPALAITFLCPLQSLSSYVLGFLQPSGGAAASQVHANDLHHLLEHSQLLSWKPRTWRSVVHGIAMPEHILRRHPTCLNGETPPQSVLVLLVRQNNVDWSSRVLDVFSELCGGVLLVITSALRTKAIFDLMNEGKRRPACRAVRAGLVVDRP